MDFDPVLARSIDAAPHGQVAKSVTAVRKIAELLLVAS